MTKNNENNGLLSAIIFFYFLVLEVRMSTNRTFHSIVDTDVARIAKPNYISNETKILA